MDLHSHPFCFSFAADPLCSPRYVDVIITARKGEALKNIILIQFSSNETTLNTFVCVCCTKIDGDIIATEQRISYFDHKHIGVSKCKRLYRSNWDKVWTTKWCIQHQKQQALFLICYGDQTVWNYSHVVTCLV